MKAVILAAGLGTRLGGLKKEKPKALLPVAERELVLRVLDFIDHPQITEKAVVVGYKADMIKRFLKKHAPQVKIFNNPNFEQGSIRSIESAASFLDDDFLLLNVDHIYPRRMLPVVLEKSRGISAVCDFDRTLGSDDMKVKLDENLHLCKIKKTLTEYDCGYIGMTYCDRVNVKLYCNTIGEVRKIYGDTAPVEWILGHMADAGHKIGICDASAVGWLEVDTKEDYNNAVSKLSRDKDFLR